MKLTDLLKKIMKPESEPASSELSARAPRVQLLPLHGLVFRRESRVIPLVNISSTGVGFLREPGVGWSGPGSVIDGELELEGLQYPVKLRVKHLSAKVVGCAFEEGDSAPLKALFPRYFEHELAALRMTEVNPEMLAAETDGQPRYLHSPDGYELFFVEKPGQEPHRFYISFLGNYFEGESGGKTRFGYVTDETNPEKRVYKGSELVRFSVVVPTEMIDAANRFVQSVPQLSATQKSALSTLLGQLAVS